MKKVYYPCTGSLDDYMDEPFYTHKDMPCDTYQEAADIAQKESPCAWDVEEGYIEEENNNGE